jgi:hypothetical protein
MFGTLVICLPSKHVGGTVCLQHGEKSMRLSTAESSAFDSFYLAWYADVTHEVGYTLALLTLDMATRRLIDAKFQIVETGYRWVLTYNLIKSHDLDNIDQVNSMDGKLEYLLPSRCPFDISTSLLLKTVPH